MYVSEKDRRGILTSAYAKNKEAIAVYAMNFLRTFALSLPGIFVPLYVFNLPGKPRLVSEDVSNNIAWIAVYYLIYTLTATLANMLLLKPVFHWLRFKRSLLLSMALLAGALFALVFTKEYFFLLFVAAILSGLTVHFYWIPFHIFFVRKTNQGGNFGEESALQLFMNAMAGIAGPLVAGVLIEQFGFRAMFLVSLFFTLCAALPVLLWVGEGEHRDHSFATVFHSTMVERRTRRFAVAFVGNAIEDVLYEMAWSLLLYFVLSDFIRVGAITTLSIGISSVLMLWIGRIIEQRKYEWLQKTSFVANALLYGARLLPLTPLRAYAIDIVDRINGKLYNVAFMSRVYDAAQEFGQSDIVIFREWIRHAAQAFAVAVVLAGLFTGLPWTFIFAFAMGASFLALYIF